MKGLKVKFHAGGRGAFECAGIEHGSGAEHSPLQVSALIQPHVAVQAALVHLDVYAQATDARTPCVVVAADLMEAAAQRAGKFSDTVKGDVAKGCGGGA